MNDEKEDCRDIIQSSFLSEDGMTIWMLDKQGDGTMRGIKINSAMDADYVLPGDFDHPKKEDK